MEGEAQKSTVIFHNVFHAYHKTRIKREEGEASINSDSIDGLLENFFSKITAKSRRVIQGENEKDNKGIKS